MVEGVVRAQLRPPDQLVRLAAAGLEAPLEGLELRDGPSLDLEGAGGGGLRRPHDAAVFAIHHGPVIARRVVHPAERAPQEERRAVAVVEPHPVGGPLDQQRGPGEAGAHQRSGPIGRCPDDNRLQDGPRLAAGIRAEMHREPRLGGRGELGHGDGHAVEPVVVALGRERHRQIGFGVTPAEGMGGRCVICASRPEVATDHLRPGRRTPREGHDERERTPRFHRWILLFARFCLGLISVFCFQLSAFLPPRPHGTALRAVRNPW